MKFNRILLLFVFAVYLVSCGTQKKLPAGYLDNVSDSTGKGEVKIPELHIQKNDLLSIKVSSASTKPEISDALFNEPVLGSAAGGGQSVSGYLVDVNGDIQYPRLGTIRAGGLTKFELAELIKKKIGALGVLTDPVISIRFLNYHVTVIGQVANQGQVTVPVERLTILEALGLAGGITDYGKKDKVKILREVDGKREVGYVDLSSKDLFESPYYNLLQNDVVLVEPTRQKAKQEEQTAVSQRISLATGLITTAALIYSIFRLK